MIKKKIVLPTLPTHKAPVASSLYSYIGLVYGPPGVGKTSFVDALSDRTLFLSTDRGTRFLPALRMEVNNYKELDLAIKALEIGDANFYKIIALDHVDDIVTMIEDYTCKSLGIEAMGEMEWAKDWRMLKKNIWSTIQRLLRLNTGLFLITHEIIKTVRTETQSERMMPDMGRSAWKVIIPKCDLVGYCGFGKKDVRVIRTAPTKHIYAKDRTRRIKPSTGCELLDGKKFLQTFNRKDSQ